MDEHSGGSIGRREAIKLGAKAAGVTAFAAPVVTRGVQRPSCRSNNVQSAPPLGTATQLYGIIDYWRKLEPELRR